MSMACSYETERTEEDRDRLAHYPEVACSIPSPLPGKRPPETSPGAVFMPIGHVFGHIS